MGILNNLSKLFREDLATTPQILTKAPGFAITSFNANNAFTNLIEPKDNYFNQYILYVAKSIEYIADKTASSEMKLYEIKNDKEVLQSDMFDDLKSFNPYMSLHEARKLRIMHLKLTGAAYWYMDRKPQENKKVEFYPLDPNNVQIMTDNRGLPAYYRYTDADGRIVDIDKNDIIYFKRMDPSNWFGGLSQVAQMAFWTNAYTQGALYNMSKLGNNINADKFLVFPGISPDEQKKIEVQLQNKYAGSRNAGRTGVLSVLPELIETSSNQKDLDYVEGMKMLRQDILAAFGIPEALLFPSATNSNSKEARILFQSDTLEPILEEEKSALNEQLIRKYDISMSKKITVYFNFENVVDEDTDMLVKQSVELYNAGLFTKNQALEYIGQEPVADGDEYKVEKTPDPLEDPKVIDDSKKIMKLSTRLDRIMKQQDYAELRRKNEKMADEQEGILYTSAENLFQDQFKRAIEYINKTDKPTVRGIFNFKDEIEITKQVFKESYAKVISNSNDVGNIEIKQKLFNVNSPQFAGYSTKSISGDAIDEITQKLEYFAKDISETTRDKLRKLMVDGIENGFDSDMFRTSIEGLFNQFVDGQGNIDILNKINSYIPNMSLDDNNNIQINEGNRYRQMLANITKKWGDGEITKSERDEALKALRGLINPADPIGKEVDALLTTVYSTNKDKGIKRSRAVTIARTEATFARNLGFDDVYKDNPFVTGKTWISASDKDTRDSHARANGTTVKLGEAFQLEGGKLRFPGDTKLGAGADEVANCRCRIVAEVN